jgi:hypothetical protein
MFDDCTFYIEFLNKEKNFRPDRIDFNTEEEAISWAKTNLEKYHPDMIRVNFK